MGGKGGKIGLDLCSVFPKNIPDVLNNRYRFHQRNYGKFLLWFYHFERRPIANSDTIRAYQYLTFRQLLDGFSDTRSSTNGSVEKSIVLGSNEWKFILKVGLGQKRRFFTQIMRPFFGQGQDAATNFGNRAGKRKRK